MSASASTAPTAEPPAAEEATQPFVDEQEAEWKAEAAAAKAAEKARRRGKKTGLGADGEKPEVIVEGLLRAMASGQVDVGRFVDPTLAVLEVENLPGAGEGPYEPVEAHRCTGATTRVRRFLRQMVKAEKATPPGEDGAIECSHTVAGRRDLDDVRAREYGASTEPPRLDHVSCRQHTPGTEWSSVHRIEWVPDTQRGWRIAAVTTTEAGGLEPDLWRRVVGDMARPRRCRP